MVAVGLLLPPLLLVPLVLGIILMTRNRVGEGIAMVALAVLIFFFRAFFYLA